MRVIKKYNEFITESLFKKDDNLRDELRKLSYSDENMTRLDEFINSLNGLNKLQIINKIKKYGYSEYLLDSKYFDKALNKFIDSGDRDELINLLNEDEIQTQIVISKQGELHKHMQEKGEKFTFGILNAIFKDAKDAKIKMDAKKAFWQTIPRGLPLLLAPFYPMLAVVGVILGTSRTFNKVIKPLFKNLDSESKYVDFLKTMVFYYMKVPEGEVSIKDRFSRAFVVEDRLIDAIKPEVVDEFSKSLSEKMANEPDDKEVPDHYIENELKRYINETFDVEPEIPLKK